MHDRLFGMKRRALRIAVLIWLGWYLSGPVCETFDFWDPPRAEMHDVRRNAGGYLTLVAAAFGLAAFFIRKWRQRSSFLPGALWASFLPLAFHLQGLAIPATPPSAHSPPLSALRI
jgi:hypothetical protein